MTNSVDFDRAVREFMNDDPLTVTYIKSSSSYSDVTGEATLTEVSIPCKAIFLDYPAKSGGDGSVANTLIRDGDKLLFLQPPEKNDALSLPLVIDQVSDKVSVYGVVYNIVTFKQTNPSANNPILYEIYLRR